MKRFNLILIFTVILYIIGHGQADTNNTILKLSISEENEIVKDIKIKFHGINKKNDLSKVEKEISGRSTEGGDCNIFYDDIGLKKIITTYYGESGKVVTEYYFWDDTINFVFRQDHQYNSPIYITEKDNDLNLEPYDESKTKIYENRYYFYNSKLIRWLDSEKKMESKISPEFANKQSVVLKDVNFIFKEARK